MAHNKDAVRVRLLAKYPADEVGTWILKGEPLNCDFSGSHHHPDLAIVSGMYRDAVEYALALDDFITWGYGGSIVKVDIIDLCKVR